MRRLRRDQDADEQLLGPFIFIGLLLIMSGLLVASASNIVASNQYSSFEYLTGWEIVGGTEYNYLDPTDGYAITSDNVTDYWGDDKATNLEYDGSTLSVDDLTVGIIRDNIFYDWSFEIPFMGLEADSMEFAYLDYIMVNMEYGWWSHEYIPLSLADITDAQLADTNQSVLPFMLHGQNYSLIVVTPGLPEDHASFIDLNLYTLYIGVPVFGSDLASISMWNLIGMIATGNLPETTPLVDVIIAALFWLTAGFMIAMIISRFIPLIGGG